MGFRFNRTRVRCRLLEWFAQARRDLPWRQTKDPYSVWVSEVMLQQTQVNTVIPYYQAFMKQFPTVQHLAAASQETVLKAWEGLGYYARARNLHQAAGIVVHEHQARLPEDWQTLRGLPGIGDYIAAAILSIAFDQPWAVLDGNVKRVLARLKGIDTPVNVSRSYARFQQEATDLLNVSCPGLHNQALMELGALICTPQKPICSECPVNSDCGAWQQNEVTRYPVRQVRAPVPRHQIAAGVVHKEGLLLITRRAPKGLLGGLWEFPGGRLAPKESAASACRREIREEVGLEVEIERQLARVKHAYTHFKIDLTVFVCRWLSGNPVLNGPVDYRWVRPDELQKFPFPKANLKFMSNVQEAFKPM